MELQQRLETEFAKQNIPTYIREWMDSFDAYSLIEEAAATLKQEARERQNYAFQVPQLAEKRQDLIEVYEWIGKTNIEKLLWRMNVMLMTSTKGTVTVHSLAGAIFHDCLLSKVHRINIAIEHVLLAFESLPYVHSITTKGVSCIFKLNFELPEAVHNKMHNKQFPLPLMCPPVASSNRDIGYHTFNEHIISGSKYKQHDKYVDLHHINRKNSVALTWETRLAHLVDFEFDGRKKYKDNGQLETDMDVERRREEYTNLKKTLTGRVAIIVKHGNKFFLAHKYDNRNRTYAKGHEFNYMSHKFIKASVQLHKTEPVKQEW